MKKMDEKGQKSIDFGWFPLTVIVILLSLVVIASIFLLNLGNN